MDSTFDCRSYKEHLASLCSLPYLVRVYPSSICCIASIIFLFQCFTNFFFLIYIFLPILFHEILFFLVFLRIISLFNVLISLYFWLCWIFVALHRPLCSSCTQASHCRVHELQYYSTQAQELQFKGPGVCAQYLWHSGLAAPQCMESSQTRDQTHVLCFGRWIPIHCTTRKV